jgi:hypothetical protein
MLQTVSTKLQRIAEQAVQYPEGGFRSLAYQIRRRFSIGGIQTDEPKVTLRLSKNVGIRFIEPNIWA